MTYQLYRLPASVLFTGGVLAPGWKVYFYLTGTTTPTPVYTTSALNVAHTQPVEADSAGVMPLIYLDPSIVYKSVVYDENDVLQSDFGADPVNDSVLSQSVIGALLYPRTPAEIAAGVTPTNYAYPELTPKRYGAAGDGAADDSSAFSSMLSVAGAGSNATIRLDKGATYLLSAWTYKSTTTGFRMDGNGATIKGPASATSFVSPGGDWSIINTTFDRWDSVVKRLLADAGSYGEWRFSGNVCKNGTGIQINWERPVNQYWITDNRFESCSGGYAHKVGENTYANQDTYLKGFISRNIYKSLTATSTTSCAASLTYGREVSITDNIIDGVQGASGEGWGIYTKVRYGVISGNRIRNVSSTSNPDVVGINIKGANRATTASPQGFNVLVFGNSLYNIGTPGTLGCGIRAQCDDVSIIGNVMERCGGSGVIADDSNGSQNILISNNRILMDGAATQYGIQLSCNGVRIRAINNIMDAVVGGVFVNPVSGSLSCADFEVSGNVINCTASGVAILWSRFTDVVGFRVTNNTIVQAGTALQDNGGAGSWTKARIHDNDFERATTKVSGSIPAGVVRDNIGYMEGSATYDPANLADGAGVTTTVTCAGASLGDYADASFSLDLQGIILKAWVSSVGTVSVRFQNESGGAIDLGSGTLRVSAARRN